MEEIKMIACKLRKGFTHWENGAKKIAGEVCHLTEAQLHAFRDRFDPEVEVKVDKVKPKAETPTEALTRQTAAVKAKAKAGAAE